MAKWSRRTAVALLTCCLVGLIAIAGETPLIKDASAGVSVSGIGAMLASAPSDQSDVEWFKKELGLSPKYVERREGVMGLSWAHFLTMVFLICSLVLALMAVTVRYRRTKELLTTIMEEKEDEPKD